MRCCHTLRLEELGSSNQIGGLFQRTAPNRHSNIHRLGELTHNSDNEELRVRDEHNFYVLINTELLNTADPQHILEVRTFTRTLFH